MAYALELPRVAAAASPSRSLTERFAALIVEAQTRRAARELARHAPFVQKTARFETEYRRAGLNRSA